MQNKIFAHLNIIVVSVYVYKLIVLHFEVSVSDLFISTKLKLVPVVKVNQEELKIFKS